MTNTEAVEAIYTATSKLYEITNDVLRESLTMDAWKEIRKIDDAIKAIRENEKEGRTE
jgi:hypothetical protein